MGSDGSGDMDGEQRGVPMVVGMSMINVGGCR